jgi:hypothetical protein
LIITISDTCKNQPKRLDFDSTINLSSLIVSLALYRHPFLYTLFSSCFTLIINNNLHSKIPPENVHGVRLEGGRTILASVLEDSEGMTVGREGDGGGRGRESCVFMCHPKVK